jgi:hypothetical protein
MCTEVLKSEQLSEKVKAEIIAIYAAEYRAWGERSETWGERSERQNSGR